MARLLYIEASPRKTRSYSIRVAKAFLDAYAAAHPADMIDTLDLWATDLPAFDGAMLDAKYAVIGGETHTPEQAAAWASVTDFAARFSGADKILISTPMWNFTIPYVLKHYLDIIVQPGLTFGWTPERGYFGLVTGKPAAVVYASMGGYGAGSGAEAIDYQKPYLQWILTFMGFADIKAIHAAPTGAPPEAIAATLAAATAEAREIAAAF